MNSEPGYNYPEREHITEPKTPAEIIRDEIKYSGEGNEMRTAILYGLGGVYGNKNLTQSLNGSSDALAWYCTEGATRSDLRRADLRMAIHCGQILSLHVGLMPLDEKTTNAILDTRLTSYNLTESDDANEQLPEAVRMLGARSMLGKCLEIEDQETLRALVEFTAHMLSDIDPQNPIYTLRRNDILFGYIHGMRVIDALQTHVQKNRD